MKIVQQTPTELTLRLRPVGLWVFGGIFAAAGLAVIICFGRATTLACNRVEPTQGSCEIAESSLLGFAAREISLTSLQGAEVETQTDSDGSTHRVVLLTRDEDIPFPFYYSSGYDKKQANASRINAFVNNPAEIALGIQDDGRWFAYPFGGIFVAAGLFVISTGKVVTCSFDKTLDRMTLRRQGLFGAEVIKHSIWRISDVQVESSIDGDDDRTYRVSFKLKAGDHLPLTSYYSGGKGDKQQTVERIRTFLKLE